MTAWEPVIGLEVHAQLLTRTKIFCGCSTAFGAAPNTQVCPVCLGLPGALPVLNREAVAMAVKAGRAFGCRIAERSVFARKNYFYPDLPKGYQISQYELPLCIGGAVQVPGRGPKALVRIHLEEDAGKNVHGANGSAVDLNRSGVPLIEIVGEPVLRSAEEASDYLKALRLTLMYLGVNDGNMEEGSFRCDANVSIRPRGAEKLGTRVELKNINSFRYVRQAIEYEIARQIELEGKVVQETRLFDHDKGETRSMRSKEEANDYRYFPEPDLQPLRVPPELLHPELPKLPHELLEELRDVPEAQTIVNEPRLARIHAAIGGDARRAALFVVGELSRALNEGVQIERFEPALVRDVWAMQDAGSLSSTAAKDVFAELIRTGEKPADIVQRKGLAQLSDTSALEAAVDAVLARSAAEVAKYRAGNVKLLGFFVGQAMRDLRGKGNPALLNELFKKKLGA